MGATSAVAHGLSGDELRQIRDAVTAGRKPKVMFTQAAGQIAGQVGQVVELADPARSDEWVVVRFGRDELPFSPSDLTIPPPRSSRRTNSKPASEPGRANSEPAPEPTAEPRYETVRDSPSSAKETSMTTADAATAGAGPRAVRRNAKAARSKGSAGLTVTLTYQDTQWSVSATQGNKALVRSQVIKPAEALKMVAFVEGPEVQQAVEQILLSERTEAEQQAEKLRAELAEVEARLAELRDAH